MKTFAFTAILMVFNASVFAMNGNSDRPANCTGKDYEVTFFTPSGYGETLVNVSQLSTDKLTTLSQTGTENGRLIYSKRNVTVSLETLRGNIINKNSIRLTISGRNVALICN